MYNSEKPYKDKILNIIRQTWKTPYVEVMKNAAIKKNFSFLEIEHTDGIGTKGSYHWQKRTFRNAVIDALAMNLNDIAIMQARAYKLQNHIFIPKEDNEAILSIISSLVKECKKRNIAITGGETSIHNNMEGLEISITMSGFMEKYKENMFELGDVLIGIKSNGLHSNGFTKIKEVFCKKQIENIMKQLVVPTEIYYDAIIELGTIININGAVHITGGAYTKLKYALPKNANAVINRNHSLKPQNIFRMLYKTGIDDEEMYRIFNCGIGYIISVKKENAQKALSFLERKKFESSIIGFVEQGSGDIIIESMFSDKELLIKEGNI